MILIFRLGLNDTRASERTADPTGSTVMQAYSSGSMRITTMTVVTNAIFTRTKNVPIRSESNGLGSKSLTT